MEMQKRIQEIRRLIDLLKEETEPLERLSKGEGAEQAQLYRDQVELVKRELNELMRLTMMLNVEDVFERMRGYGPKAEEEVESFGAKVADVFKSFVEAFKGPSDSKEEPQKPPEETLTRDQARALHEEYLNLVSAGFSETQAMELIRARCKC